MHKRYKTLIVSIIALVGGSTSLFSVGFSSWIVSKNDNIVNSGGINVDNVFMMTGFSLIESSGFNYDTYFYISNGNKSSTGNLTFTFDINPNKIDDDFKSTVVNNNYSFTIYGKLSFSIEMNNDNAANYISNIYWNSSAANYSGKSNNIYFSKTVEISTTSNTQASLVFTFNNGLIGKYADTLIDNMFKLELGGGDLSD